MTLTPLVLAAASLSFAQNLPLDGRMVDLTHPVAEKAAFGVEGHEGTHVDAPKAFARSAKAKAVDELPLERSIIRFVLIDVSRWAGKNRSYQARVSDLADWEKYHGRIPERVVVLIRTGYSRHWGDREKYLGNPKRSRDPYEYLRFPGLHPAAADWLAKRGVAGVGIDSAAVDHGLAREPQSRRTLAEAGIPVYENLDNLDGLPEKGGWLLVFPMKVKGAATVPVRAVALLEG